MELLDAIKKVLGVEKATPGSQPAQAAPARREPEPEAPAVPEVAVRDLVAEMKAEGARTPFLLDIREPYERRQGHIPDNLHIPMNSLPARLSELPRDADIVVYCAHGNRSYSVAGWLLQQGYAARSLKGGIAAWGGAGGAIERG